MAEASAPDFNRRNILFGGTFDPIHLGHLRAATACLHQLPHIDDVVFMPSYRSPGKHQPVASPEDRLAMLHAALQESPFSLWDFEIVRKQTSYTIESLQEAHKRGASRERLWLLVGADRYPELETWRDGEKIRDFCQIVAVNRPGFALTPSDKRDLVLDIPPTDLAAEKLRSSLAKGQIPANALPQAVEHYLNDRFLRNSNPYDK